MGCGGSGGVPFAGNVWLACDPGNPKNNRTRPSIYIERGETRIVIDTGPEFRMQMNRANATGPLSAVLYTHGHSDHTNGMDDLRSFWFQNDHTPIPGFANPDTIELIHQRFFHIVASHDPKYPNTMTLHPVEKQIKINDITLHSYDGHHYRDGTTHVTGYRIGDFGYTTDITMLSENGFDTLKGVKIWVVGVFWRSGDFTHPGVDEILEWNKRIGAEQIFLTHMTAHMDYDILCQTLPDHIRPAYDGLEFLL